MSPESSPRLGEGSRLVGSTRAQSDIRAVALSPDGTRMAVAAGARVLLHDASTTPRAALLATLKAHKDAAVTSLDWSPDGQRFASAGEDGRVVVWSELGQGMLKYATHGPVLQLTHEPCPPHRLCSVSAQELAFWTPGTKAVRKQRCGGGGDDDGAGTASVSCVAWSPDGQRLALASVDGSIALRDAALGGGGGGGGGGSNDTSIQIDGGPENGAVRGMAWTAAGTLVVGRSGGLLTFYRDLLLGPASSSTPPVTVRLDSNPLHLRHLKDEVLVLGADGSLTVWASRPHGPKRRTAATLGFAITAIAAAASLVALGTAGGHLHLFSMGPSAGHLGRYAEGKEEENEAASAAAASKSPADALEALTAAGRWDEALALVASAAAPHGGVSASDVLRRRAQWHVARSEWRAAVDALVAAGDPLRALALVEERVAVGGSGLTGGNKEDWWWPARLLDLARSVDVAEAPGREVVRACARLLASHDDGDERTKALAPMAREAFLRLGDVAGLMAHLTRRQRWREVGALARKRPGQFDAAAFVPYAGWLAAERGCVDEAVAALRAMGAVGEARRLLLALIDNAVVEGRFKDASYCHWVLAVEALHQQQDKRRQAFAHHNTLADLYFAYSHIHTHARQPFTKLAPHTLLQAASFLLRSLRDDPANNSNPPPGISRVHTLYAFATQAEKLGAQATARRAYDELAALQLPPAWRDAVDLRRLKLRSDETTTATDPPDLLPLCYRCGLRNPLLPTTAAADCCQGCGYPFIRSPLTLEVLALVEFAPDPAEVPSAAQALALLRATDDADTDADGGDGTQCGEGARRFNACVARALGAQQQRQQPQRQRPQPKREQLSTGQTRPRASSSSASASASVAYAPVLLGAQDLRSLRREEVFVVHGRLRSGAHEAYGQRKQRQHQHQQGTRQPGGTLLPCRYYRNVLHPDAPLALSQAAGRFFGKEAFEAAWLLAQEEEEEAEDERLVDERAEEETTTKRTEGPCCPFSRVRGVGGYGSL